MKLFDICKDCNRLKSTLMSFCADCGSYKVNEWNIIFEHDCLELAKINSSNKEKVKILRENFQWILTFEGNSIKIKTCLFCQRVLKHQLGISEEGAFLEEDIREYISIIKKSI